MNAILITDCLQYDFVGSIDRFEPLPNMLHVGHDESRRLLGEDPREGPVARMIAWAHAQPDDELRVIHVRDWHDPGETAQREHLDQFGPHCLRDTRGAQFVFRTDDVAPAKRLGVVNATTLSNFVGATLGDVLAASAGRSARVGLMGVWTEAKITFLAYELRVRYPQFQLAVCSALTASSSRNNHFVALDQLERILGVRVLSSVGEFIDFLGGHMEDAPLIGFSHKHPEIELREPTRLAPVDEDLVRYLFRGCRRVRLKALDGGFSGNAVLGTESVDMVGHEQVPHVVKIGARGPIAKERESFERVEAVLGNAAPRVADFADLKDRGAIKYRYAAMGRGDSRSFQKVYESGCDEGEVRRILDIVFRDQLGKFYRAAEPERCDLLEYYAFSPAWSESVRANVESVIGPSPDMLEFAGGRRVPSIATFYQRHLDEMPRLSRSHYFAQVHGDLNGANIIVDAQSNVWLIDFFHSHRGHVLRDLIKMENDVLYIFSKIDGPAQLEEALSFTDALLSIEDLGRPLPPIPADITSPVLSRAWGTVNHLRGFYPELVRADRETTQLLVGQIRYAVHTLSFQEANPWQKRWALYTASSAAAQLRRRTAGGSELRIDWLPARFTAPGRLGLTLLPGRRDMGRVLADDIGVMRAAGVGAVVCLLSPDEFHAYGVDDLLAEYRAAGFEVYHQPIIDGRVPSADELSGTVSHVISCFETGKTTVVHCVGGLGRAGTVAACVLRAQGLDAEQAIAEVRAVRSERAIETAAQEQAVADFSALR